MANNIKSGKRGIFSKIFWGALFLVAAAYFVMRSIGFDADVNIFQIIIGVILGIIAIRSIFVFEWFGVFVPIALFITIAQSTISQFFGVDLNIWAVWLAAVALSIGMSILIRRRRPAGYDKSSYTTFAGTTKRFKAEEIDKISVEARFGGEKIIIEDGELPKDATINFDLSFAGVGLHVPGNWQIVDNVDKSLGGISEENRPAAGKKEQTLTLTGSLSFSGIEITYI